MIMIHDLQAIKKLIPMAEKFLQEAISADILLFFTRTFSVPHWVFDKPGNGAVEMLSRRTMQIRPYPLGDTKWLQPQQNLQRGVCVCLQYVRISNKSVPLAICRQIGQLEQKNNINNNKKKRTKQRAWNVWLNVHLSSNTRRSPCWFWENIFSHADPVFGRQNQDGCQIWTLIQIPQ